MDSQKPESRATLGRAELDLLQYVDSNPGVTVGDAAVQFGGPRGLARTTVLTMMQRLVTKGFLKRKQVKAVYRYTARVPASRTVSELVSDFVSGVLGGSVSPFVAYLSQAQDLSEQDVNELRKLVEGLDQRTSRPRPKPGKSKPAED
jgi:predicted transcriptional regulator